MSNINIDIETKESSEGISVDIRVIPSNERVTEASSSDSESSCSNSEKERRCIIEIQVEARLSRGKGVTIRLLQSNLHRVRIYTPEDIKQALDALNPNKDSLRVWSPENYIPWKFEIEIQEHEREPLNPLKRPASRPGSPQQEAGGPREASRCPNQDH